MKMMLNITTTVFWVETGNESEEYDPNRNGNDNYANETTDLKYTLYRTVVPVMILFCIIAFITNLSILMSVRWIRRNLSPTLCFSISLAVADAYSSLVIGIGLLVNSLLPIAYNIHLYSMCFILTLEGFRLGGMIVSVLHLLLLAVNHYIGIIRPLHYASTMTRGKAMLNIAMMWILPIIFFFVYFSSIAGQGFQSYQCENMAFFLTRQFRYITGGLFFVPLFIMFFMYVHIFIIVIRHNRGLSQYQGSRNFRHNVKAATTTLLILGTYTVGWMPAVLFYVIACYDCTIILPELDSTVVTSVSMIINTLIILKLTVNPIIYAARMKEISGAMKRMVSFWVPKLRESNDAGGTGGGTTDDLSHSSFIKSRNDTLCTTIRMQSVASGRSNRSNRKDEPSPILVYQKCDKNNSNNSLHNTSCNKHNSTYNGVSKSTSNGIKSKATTPTNDNYTVTTFATSPISKNNSFIDKYPNTAI